MSTRGGRTLLRSGRRVRRLWGTHKGDLPRIPATGKRFSSVRGATILELEAGKIRREADYWDAATFMKQVGVLPSQ